MTGVFRVKGNISLNDVVIASDGENLTLPTTTAITSAETLSTPRTINGTFFDGSANIVTSSWGASRSITLGNTAKNVDGSTPVTWTLAEIGAQATLQSGTNIKTINNTSLLGSGNITVTTDLTGYATETYVNTAISNLVDTAPAALDTLNELAAALGDDPNFATTVATSIGNKAPLNDPTFTGVVTMSSLDLNSTTIALGTNSGNGQLSNAIAIGENAGSSGQLNNAISIGINAGATNQGQNSIAIGINAASFTQNTNAVAIGPNAGGSSQGIGAIALGASAGNSNQTQGNYAIAIGHGAGAGATGQPARTIILNALGSNFNGVASQTDSFYVNPIRNDATNTLQLVYYNTTTKELTYTTKPTYTISDIGLGKATSTTQGLVKVASDTIQTVAANAVSATANRTYATQFNSADQLVVNVPWTDTTYSQATSTTLGLIELFSDTVQSTAANSVTTAASRTYGLQVNSNGQGVINVPWTDTTYSQATSSVLGLVKLGSDTQQTTAANSVTTTASRTYAVQLNASGQMVVNVPWSDTDTNTTYSAGTGITLTGTTFSIPQAITTTSSVQFGSFGVGTAASGTTGEIRATNNITAYYSSDAKFKENIQDIPNATEIVLGIGGKIFDWTDDYIKQHGGEDGYFIQKQDFGVIAQDVQKRFPRAIRVRPDGSLAVDYEKLSALAFAAICEQEVRIKRLEALVDQLMKG